ncbi:hypothetical protein [Nocardia sienata]|nr:hypothetical protein [Nocardia sienata]
MLRPRTGIRRASDVSEVVGMFDDFITLGLGLGRPAIAAPEGRLVQGVP